MSEGLLLIIGSPRSGTTLLNAMIGCHPEIATINEDFGYAVFNIVSKKIVGNKLCIPNQIELTDRGSYVRRQMQKRNLFQYSPQSDLCIEDYLKRGARIIATLRHPDPVIESIQTRGRKSRKLATYRWVRAIEIIDSLHRRLGSKMLLVPFSKLVSEPEKVMTSAAAFLNVEFDRAMLEGYAHTPIYSNQGIDASKASEAMEPVSDRVREEASDAVAAYLRLIGVAEEIYRTAARPGV